MAAASSTDIATQANYESESAYVYRAERFRHGRRFPFQPDTRLPWSAFPSAPGVLQGTNNQVVLGGDNVLHINLFHQGNDKGFYADDVLAFVRDWLLSSPGDAHQQAAATAINGALLILDNRAVERHGYNQSPLEKAAAPDVKAVVGGEKNWDQLYTWITPAKKCDFLGTEVPLDE